MANLHMNLRLKTVTRELWKNGLLLLSAKWVLQVRMVLTVKTASMVKMVPMARMVRMVNPHMSLLLKMDIPELLTNGWNP